MTSEVHFKDFTKEAPRVCFRIGSEDFDALPMLPIPVMQELIRASVGIQAKELGAEALDKVLQIFNLILVPESAVRFQARISSVDNPVDLTQVMDIMTWLMERYGKRPTQQSPESSNGFPTETGGMISTAGVPSSV